MNTADSKSSNHLDKQGQESIDNSIRMIPTKHCMNSSVLLSSQMTRKKGVNLLRGHFSVCAFSRLHSQDCILKYLLFVLWIN